MATKVIRSSCNLSDANNCYTSDKAFALSATCFDSGTAISGNKLLAITFATNHNSKGVLIPLNEIGDPNYIDWSVTIELQKNIAGTWTTQGDVHTFTPAQIIQKTNSSSGGLYLVDCEWKTGGTPTPIAVTTPANTWRLRVSRTGGTSAYNWVWAGINTTSLGYCEYTTTVASFANSDDLWMTGNITVNNTANVTLNHIIQGTGVTFNPFAANNITITQAGTVSWFLFSNVYSHNGTLLSPRTGCKWNCFRSTVINVSGVTYTSKYAMGMYGAIPTLERCEITASVPVGDSAFYTSDDVSSWKSGERFFFSIRDIMGISADQSLYTLDGDPVYSAGEYTVNFTPALAAEDVVVNSLFTSKVCRVDGYGITFEGNWFYFRTDICPMKREFSGVSFITDSKLGAPQLSYSTNSYNAGDTSDIGATTSDHCSFIGDIMAYPISVYGWGASNSHILGGLLSYGARQTSLPGILVPNTQNIFGNGVYVETLCAAGTTANNIELSNFDNSFNIDGSGYYTNFKLYGVQDGGAGALLIQNSLLKITNITLGKCAMAIGNNGTSNIGCNFINVQTVNNIIQYGYSNLIQTVINGTNEAVDAYQDNNGLDRNFWLRITDYIVEGDYLSYSRSGYFICQSDTKMTVKTTQSRYDNPASYRVLTGTINGSKVYVSAKVQISNAAYYAGVHTLPALTGTYDLTLTETDSATASTSLQKLEIIVLPTVDNQEMAITINQNTDAGQPNGDVVWSDFVLNVREYGKVYQSFTKNLQYTTGEIFQTIADKTDNVFVTETDSATVAAYTGATINHSTKTATFTGTWTLFMLYDYAQYNLTLDANLSYPEWLTTLDKSTFTIDASWTVVVSGTMTGLTETLSGTKTISTGAFFEDKTGAIFNKSGDLYYAKHINRNVKDSATSSNQQYAVVSAFHSDGTELCYNTSLTLGGLATDASGNVEAYYVWKKNSTVYTITEYIGLYAYQWSIIPMASNGLADASTVRLNTDAQVTLTRTNALAVSGITVSNSGKIIDLNAKVWSEANDNLKARQASTSTIESGVKGYICYYNKGWLLSRSGTTYTGLADWKYSNNGNTGTFQTGTLIYGVAGSYTHSFGVCTLQFSTAGTYDFTASSFNGTVTLTNTSGGAVTVKILPSVTYVNTGPNITIDNSVTVSIVVSGLVAGSGLRINNSTDNVLIYDGTVAGTSHSESLTYTADKALDIRITKTGYLPFQTLTTLSIGGANVTANQQVDTTYVTNAIDGSTVPEFSADYPNILVDIDDPDGIGYIKRFYAWFRYTENTPDGRAYFFGGVTAYDTVNYVINSAIVDLKFKNLGITVTFSDAYIIRDDGASMVATGSNSIIFEPGRAYSVNGGGGGGSAHDVWNEPTVAYTTPDTFGKDITDMKRLLQFIRGKV